METQSWVCTECKQRTAKSFCHCKKDPAFLCEECLHRHINKVTGIHTALPVEAYGSHLNPGYSERLQARMRNVETGKEELLRSLRLFDDCIKHLKAAVEGQINTLNIWLAGKTADLRVQKANVEGEMMEAIKEVMDTMYQEQPELSRPFSVALRNYTPSSTFFEVFKYTINSEALFCSLNEVLKLEVAATQFSYIPHIDFSTLNLFNCAEKNWEQPIDIRPKLLLSSDTQLIMIEKRCVFVCGGQGGSRKAYIVKMDGVCKDAGEMSEGRSSPGAVHYHRLGRNCVFVFGGYPDVRSCECYSFPDGTWQSPLPQLHTSHSYFTPALHNNDIYLIGGCCQSVEVYSPEKNEIRKLSIVLPEAEACATVLGGSTATVFSVNYFASYTIREDGEMIECSAPRWLSKPLETYLKSCVCLGTVVFLHKDGFAAWFDLSSGAKLGHTSL